MIVTMDSAGRLVIPKALRQAAGLVPGEVEIDAIGTTLTLQAPTAQLVEKDGLLMLASGTGLGGRP
ncbi:MAG: AbrB/MazE/SpoVT family DNA-binding domain-containing protein [Propionibacteriaceae bacterium]|nr:AbrB/MazE/SpoVT family DNA-binding domain-containing protein [Propionibacteriaceae bacterium]